MVLLLFLAPAQAEEPAEHAVVEAISVQDEASATVQGPPAGCVALLTVAVPFEQCPRNRGGEAEFPGRLEGEPATSGRCGLVCDDREPAASWYFALDTEGYRGKVSCSLAGPEDPRFELTVSDEAFVPGAIGSIWLDRLAPFGFQVPSEPGATLVLSAENRCPAGQATR